jgi:lambda repressor-like predicted transcriptional regulator
MHDPPTRASIPQKEKNMYPRSIIAAVFLAVIPLTAVAQSKGAVKDKSELDPPSIQSVLSRSRVNSDEVISQLLDVKPEIPLGPIDVLRGYESAMTAIEQTTVVALFGISQAALEGQISRQEAEYLTQERYQVSMMQYQLLRTLHASLEHDIEQAPAQSSSPHEEEDTPDLGVVVVTSSATKPR